jgi:hypothetical protein
MGRKIYPPFDDGYGVPVSAWVSLMLKVPQMFETVYQVYKIYRSMTWENSTRKQRLKEWQRWVHGPESTALNAVIQLEFHYSENSIKNGDVITRAMKHYRKYRDEILKSKCG